MDSVYTWLLIVSWVMRSQVDSRDTSPFTPVSIMNLQGPAVHLSLHFVCRKHITLYTHTHTHTLTIHFNISTFMQLRCSAQHGYKECLFELLLSFWNLWSAWSFPLTRCFSLQTLHTHGIFLTPFCIYSKDGCAQQINSF